MLLGLSRLSVASVHLAEAVGDERGHAEFLGHGESLTVMLLRFPPSAGGSRPAAMSPSR